MKNYIKQDKGISLVALIITIIVMLILAGVAIANIVIDSGIVEKAISVKDLTKKAEIIEKIKTEYFALKNSEENIGKSNIEIFNMLKEKLNLSTEFIGSECMIIEIIKGEFITLLESGEVIDGKKICLNIADGNIDLKASGFIQNNNTLIEYNGDYIISGTTTEYCVRIMEEGNYNVTIKNLNIDMTGKGKCAFNANRGLKPTGCYVTVILEGNNKLIGGDAPGLGFAKATPNVDGITNGSTLTIEGDGKLEVIGGKFSAGIGSGYSGLEVAAGDVANIIINSGEIIAKTGSNGCPIGGSLYKNVNNIIINGGNITANASNRHGIGSIEVLENLVINGGNITATGGEYGGAIGGGTGSGEILIKGGTINARHEMNYSRNYATLGQGCSSVRIEGGIINCYSKEGIGIGSMKETPIKLNIVGGQINVESKTCSIPTNIENGTEMFLVKLKLENLAKQTKLTSLITSDNINFDITTRYTTRDGHVFIYLPEGERTVTVEVGGITYSGTVTTTADTFEVTTLTQN